MQQYEEVELEVIEDTPAEEGLIELDASMLSKVGGGGGIGVLG